MATVAEIIGFELPGNCAEDSTSLLPLFTGERERLPDRPLVINHDYSGNFAIRKGKWKLIEESGFKLYDLSKDPKESKELSGSHPEIVKELSAVLDRYRSDGRSR